MKYPVRPAKPRPDLLRHPPRPTATITIGNARRVLLTCGVAVTEYLLAGIAFVAAVLAHQPPPPDLGKFLALTAGGLVLTTGLVVALVRLMGARDHDRLPRSRLRLVRFASGAAVVGLLWGLVTLPAAPVIAFVVPWLFSRPL